MNAYKLDREESEYQEWLDEIYDEIDVCGYKYPASKVLEDVDPTAYRCGLSDWESEQDDIWVCNECNERYDDEYEANNCCRQEEYAVTYRKNYHASPDTIRTFDDEEDANDFLRAYVKEWLEQKGKDGFDTDKIIEDGAWDLENDTEFNYDLGTWSVETI